MTKDKLENKVENRTEYLPLAEILADEQFNCRGGISMPSIIELAKNIKAKGLIQPVVVGPVREDGKRLLVAGYRRYKAHQYLKKETIFAVIRDDLVDEHGLMLVNFQENLQRVNLDVLQEGKMLLRLMEAGTLEEKLPKVLNRSPTWVKSRLQAIALPRELHADIISGRFTARNVKELYRSMTDKPFEAFVEDVKWLKTEKEGGKIKATLVTREARLKKEHGAKQRTRAEIYTLQKRVADKFGPAHVATKILGWVNGHVTGASVDEELE